MKHQDVIIIGGGLIGACCADVLTGKGLETTLIERRFPASGSSRACDGLILLWDKNPGPELALGQASVGLWENLVPQLDGDVEFRQSGTVLVAEDENSLERSRQIVADIAAQGITATLLERRELQEIEPALAVDLAGGAIFPQDYQIDPRRATLSILRKAQRQGLQLVNGEQVIELRRHPGRSGGWEVATQKHLYAADFIVCAAGVWTTKLLHMLAIELPIRPRKGQILVIKAPRDLIRHPLLEGSYGDAVHAGTDDLQVALVAEMTPAGTMLVGSSRQFAGFNTRVSRDVLQALARRATRFIPDLGGAQWIRSYAGLRPWSPDHLPLIGPVAGFEGLYLATGHEGAGICLAPVTGELIGKWITEEISPSLADAISPGRFYDYHPEP